MPFLQYAHMNKGISRIILVSHIGMPDCGSHPDFQLSFAINDNLLIMILIPDIPPVTIPAESYMLLYAIAIRNVPVIIYIHFKLIFLTFSFIIIIHISWSMSYYLYYPASLLIVLLLFFAVSLYIFSYLPLHYGCYVLIIILIY